MGPIQNEDWPSDPFNDHFSNCSASPNPLLRRKRSYSVLRDVERPFAFTHHHDEIYTRSPSFQREGPSFQSTPASAKSVKSGMKYEEQRVSRKDVIKSKKFESEGEERKDRERVITYITDLTETSQQSPNTKETGGDKNEDMTFLTDLAEDSDLEEDGSKPRLTANDLFITERRQDLTAAASLATVLTDAFESEQVPARTRTTLNDLFIAERQADLATTEASKLAKEQETEATPEPARSSFRKRATKPRLWLTSEHFQAKPKIDLQPPQPIFQAESHNVSTLTVNTSILFPPTPLPVTSPVVTSPTLTSPPAYRADATKIQFPPLTASRFEVQNWLHALFRAHQTPPLPAFSLYHLEYTGIELHSMAVDGTLEASDLTRTFIADLIKTGGASIAQAEIVHWEILSFGEENAGRTRESGRMERMGSIVSRRSSLGGTRRSMSADEERRAQMAPYMMGALQSPDVSVEQEREALMVGNREVELATKTKETGATTSKIKKLVKGLAGLRISVKVEFKTTDNH